MGTAQKQLRSRHPILTPIFGRRSLAKILTCFSEGRRPAARALLETAMTDRPEPAHPVPKGAHRFPKAARLVRRGEFLRLRRRGRTVRGAVLAISFLDRLDHGPVRLGLVVSRRAGPAVRRNRIKRIFREVFRHERGLLPSGLDITMGPIDPEAASSYEQVEAEFRALAARIEGLVSPKPMPPEPAP